jgi:pyruvate dehydrogenase E2 component (dihydrolipoamide acetyltransferase)
MSVEFRLPELGENITRADVVNVLVKVGDTIQKDQPLFEMETEKATFEVPSSVSGVVKEIRVKTGDKVEVGQVLLLLEEGEGSSKSPPSKDHEPAKAKTTQQKTEEKSQRKPLKSIAEETQKKESSPEEAGSGSPQEEGAPKKEKSTSHRTQERPEETGKETKKEPAKEAGDRPVAPIQELPASPMVRRLAREMNVDLSQVRGLGPDGRITPEDVKNFIQPSVGATGRSSVIAGPLPDFSKWGSIERKPMSNIRRTTAEHVSRAWSAIPHVTQFDEADITGLEKLRKRFAKRVELAGGNLNLTAILLKVAASALKVFPQMNASVDLEHEEVIYKNYFHIGIATATERGLLVPVIRDVDQKNILDLSIELHQITDKARGKKLTLEEMQGASFTITNLGNIGGDHFTPIINWPEVAILGVGRSKVESVWVNDKFEPRTMLPLTLSYDHRLIDGADGAKFLRWLAEAVTEPFLMDLEG